MVGYRPSRKLEPPPSTAIRWPLTYDAPADTRKATTSATSSGRHTRPYGLPASSSAARATPLTALASRSPMSVATSPGATTLTCIPWRISSPARAAAGHGPLGGGARAHDDVAARALPHLRH